MRVSCRGWGLGCERCHGPLKDFNVNGAQTEIEDLMKPLADLLPKTARDASVVADYYREGNTRGAAEPMTDKQLRAAWNYRFVFFGSIFLCSEEV
jgi:hypothetical protein